MNDSVTKFNCDANIKTIHDGDVFITWVALS